MCAANNLVEEKMNFTFMPSLKYMALVKVTTELWNLSDIRNLVARSSFTFYSTSSSNCIDWKVIEQKVIEKVTELPLPELLKKEIVDIIQPIAFEIREWKRYFLNLLSLANSQVLLTDEEYTKLLTVLCWTQHGTVEKKKTAEVFIKDDNLDVTKRYVLACNFCLEDDIKELWNSLPQTEKVTFYDEGHSSFSEIHHRLIVLWTYDIKGELSKLNGLFKDDAGREISAYHFAFQNAALHGNKTATEYFLQKLTTLEREAAFLWYTEYVRRRDHRGPLDADVLCFLLSQMNEVQQVKVFAGDPLGVLSSLLDWPWQNFFMKAANRMWDFLSEQDYVSVLRRILLKIFVKTRQGFKDCNYHKLFGEFFEQGPSTCKKYFLGNCALDAYLLQELFVLENKETIKLILKNASDKAKEEIIFNFIRNNIHRWPSTLYDWDFLKFIVQEYLLSEDIMIKFKQEFKRRIHNLSGESSEIEKYTNFLEFLDDFINKNSKKRKIEGGNTSPAKRLK